MLHCVFSCMLVEVAIFSYQGVSIISHIFLIKVIEIEFIILIPLFSFMIKLNRLKFAVLAILYLVQLGLSFYLPPLATLLK